MRSAVLAGGVAALALASTWALAQDRPTDLLPPGFDDPTPAPSPTPRPSAAPSPGQSGQGGDTPAPVPSVSGEVVQPLPTAPSVPTDPSLDLSDLPSLRELEEMTTDELDELLGLKPRYDIPPAAQRSLAQVGALAPAEGGLPTLSLSRQPASLVRAILNGTQGPLVSRWGHILLRRALASRLAAPDGMDPVEFAALRAGVLNRMGEHGAARAIVQDVDTGNFNAALLDAAIDAYIGTADIVGACPAVRLADSDRDDPQWKLLGGICNSYAGEETRGGNDIRRVLNGGSAARIDALLAQRYAGAAGTGRRAVNIEWDGVEELTPWRFALANALGEPLPDALLEDLSPYYVRASATAPMLPLARRAAIADRAAADGILSSAAMVDIFSQVHSAGDIDGAPALVASRLREAYVGAQPADRLAAIRDIWSGDPGANYGRMVLTAYAAARMPPQEEFASDAAPLLASMLAAGLDRDALRWGAVVEPGSTAWGLLALAAPQRNGAVSDGDLSDFLDNDDTGGQARSRMLLAGLAGLGRVNDGEVAEYSERLSVDLARQNRWTQTIARAAEANNPTLVALLAGLGMQGSGWDRMTALHLYHIVRALNQVGLDPEARMIAAEAVARA